MFAISEDRLQKAMTYLAETDEKSAILKADVARQEYIKKRQRAVGFLSSTGTVAEREAKAEISPEVEKAENDYTKALEKSEAMAAKRKTEALIVEVWRSCNANRRQGG